MSIPITPWIPAKNPQFIPSTSTSAKDCVASVTARLLERATVGALRHDHADVRKASGAPSTRGLYLYEAAAAARKLASTELDIALSVSRNTVRDTVAGGEAVGLTGHTKVTRYTTRKTNYYIGPHEVDLMAYSWWPKGEICACERRTAEAHAEFTVYDPGVTSVGPRQWSAGLVYRFGEALTGAYNRINLLVAPDTEGRPWVAVAAAAIRSQPSYSTGKQLGATVKGKTYPGGRTQKGGGWKRADGLTYANGWIHIKRTSTAWGWIKGRAAA